MIRFEQSQTTQKAKEGGKELKKTQKNQIGGKGRREREWSPIILRCSTPLCTQHRSLARLLALLSIINTIAQTAMPSPTLQPASHSVPARTKKTTTQQQQHKHTQKTPQASQQTPPPPPPTKPSTKPPPKSPPAPASSRTPRPPYPPSSHRQTASADPGARCPPRDRSWRCRRWSR